ncbi:MAG TPA: PQQ-dependent sugar dehydrogenase [Dermatophilaceae bacterium]
MSTRAVWTLLLVLAVAGCAGSGDSVTFPSAPAPTSRPTATPSSAPVPSAPPSSAAVRETIATGLPVPWGLAFLPDGTALVTLRDRGEVLHVARGSGGGSRRAPAVSVGHVPGVQPGGEGGLLGIAVSPAFASDRSVFVYLTSSDDNRVIAMTFDGTRLTPGAVIVRGIPKAGNHNGGRLAFGPDGYLYISTGDATRRDPAQDKASLSGKILRVTTGGAPAPGNPFPGSAVWSLGHRNVQGMAWDKAGTMYASELGHDAWDELNLIQPGRNYGWPVVEGIAHQAGFVDPLVQWPTDDASPSGIAVGADGAIYLAALRGESLWRIPLEGKGRTGKPQRLLHGTYGRLRTVMSAPDRRLWLFTSNTFRGTPRPGDDRILALPLPVH